jgi:hypothetical protein
MSSRRLTFARERRSIVAPFILEQLHELDGERRF